MHDNNNKKKWASESESGDVWWFMHERLYLWTIALN